MTAVAEPRNGLGALLRAWPIITTVGGVFAAFITWQFVMFHRDVATLKQGADQTSVVVQQLPALIIKLDVLAQEQSRRRGRGRWNWQRSRAHGVTH